MDAFCLFKLALFNLLLFCAVCSVKMDGILFSTKFTDEEQLTDFGKLNTYTLANNFTQKNGNFIFNSSSCSMKLNCRILSSK